MASMNTMFSSTDSASVEAVRRFNRFHTARIGAFDRYLDSTLSLAEVRVLYELAHREQPTASDIAQALGLDAGYLSRILRGFDRNGWLARSRNPADARQSHLALTDAGQAAFAPLQQRSRDQAAALLGPLAPADRQCALDAMQTLQNLLAPEKQPLPRTATALLREPKPGDIGWVIEQHGEIYAREYGWNSEFEALVAEIAGQFLRQFQPEWERCWIAEVDGERAGAVFVVRKSKTVAQLRMLILTPQARGFGLGARLTD